MKIERGMGTLMTVFSGVAALLCLLVGLQLLSLEVRIGQTAAQPGTGSDTHFQQWKDEVHTGAVMSFGAGILILLFGLRHQATRHRAVSGRPSRPEADDPTIDLDSLSVRIFEVDADDQSIEITAPDEDTEEFESHPEPRQWAPLVEDDPDPHTAPPIADDPADSILNSIREASGSEMTDQRTPTTRKPVKSFWSKIFRLRK